MIPPFLHIKIVRTSKSGIIKWKLHLMVPRFSIVKIARTSKSGIIKWKLHIMVPRFSIVKIGVPGTRRITKWKNTHGWHLAHRLCSQDPTPTPLIIDLTTPTAGPCLWRGRVAAQGPKHTRPDPEGSERRRSQSPKHPKTGLWGQQQLPYQSQCRKELV